MSNRDTAKKGLAILAGAGKTGIDRYMPDRLHVPGQEITKEEIEYMKSAAMAGSSAAEVADALGIDRRTFVRWIEEKPGLAREWKAAQAAGRIGLKRTIFEMGMDGKFQAAALAAVNLTDFKFAGRSEPEGEEQAVALTGDMSKSGVLAKMAEEINKLPEADRIEIAKQISSGVIATPSLCALGLSEDSGKKSGPQIGTVD